MVDETDQPAKNVQEFGAVGGKSLVVFKYHIVLVES